MRWSTTVNRPRLRYGGWHGAPYTARDTHRQLRQGLQANTWGQNLRLEQERIVWREAIGALAMEFNFDADVDGPVALSCRTELLQYFSDLPMEKRIA